MPKFFHTFEKQPNIGENFVITGSDAAHIALSLRCKTGDVLRFGDLNGNDLDCLVTKITKASVTLQITAVKPSDAEPHIPVSLFLCVTKGDKFDFVVQKATELGVFEIYPVISEFCISRPDSQKGAKMTERWNKIAKEAAMQSGRGIIPRVHEIISLKKAVQIFTSTELPLFFYENAQVMLSDTLSGIYDVKSVSVFIGSEGGFSQTEADILIESGAQCVSLGKRILRAETAPIAVLGALNLALGEF